MTPVTGQVQNVPDAESPHFTATAPAKSTSGEEETRSKSPMEETAAAEGLIGQQVVKDSEYRQATGAGMHARPEDLRTRAQLKAKWAKSKKASIRQERTHLDTGSEQTGRSIPAPSTAREAKASTGEKISSGLARPGDPPEVPAMEASESFRGLHAIAQANLREAMRAAPTAELRAEILEAATSPELAAVGETEQKGRAHAIKQAIGHRDFGGIGAELQREVIRSAAAGRGRAAELMKAATFTPQTGRINVHPSSGADYDTFCHTMRRAMVRSPSFRGEMFGQNKDAKHPITMHLGRGQPRTFVDASHMLRTPPEPGVHTVDLADLAHFGTEPGRPPRPNATTQDQLLIHFMVEARREARTDMSDPRKARNAFRDAHKAGIEAENKFRQEMGQKGRVVGHYSSASNPNEIIFEYKGHSNETITIDNHAQITSIMY
jgi:hypothetical protein